MRPQGSPAEFERRRLRAIELLQRDRPVHVVAERLGVDRRSVRRWKRAHRRQGRAGLRARPASGRPPKLTAAQRHRLARLVIAGPEAAGYRTGLWTCRRIVDLIRSHFNVVYHPDHVGRLLRACGLSPQRPQPRARERDDRRVAPASPRHPGPGAVSPAQHSGPPGAAVPSPSRPSRARALRSGLGSWALAPARARPNLAGRSSALPQRLASAVRAGPQSRGTALELPQVRPPRELRPRHRRRDPDHRGPGAPPPGLPSAAAEAFLSPLGTAFSCLRWDITYTSIINYWPWPRRTRPESPERRRSGLGR